MNSFFAPTKIIYGDGLAEHLVNYNKVFIVTDGFMKESGIVNYVVERLGSGTVHNIFSDVKADPDMETVNQGVDLMLQFSPDVVVAFGGGSPIDAAKAIIHYAEERRPGAKCPLIAIPTTSGTGSEVTSFSVITDRQRGVKIPLSDESLIPDVALLDANLTKTVPPAITADTGIDVLTHAIEAYVSIGSSDFTDAAAEKAIELVWQHLLNAYSNPDDLTARQGMHNASCLAGMAFSNAGLGLVHGMAHALGARFHIPHGRSNAILLPYVMIFNAGCADTLTTVADQYAEISRLIALDATSTRQSAWNLITTIKRTIAKLNIPTSIKAAGIDQKEFEEALPSMAKAVLEDRCTATNPKQITEAEVIELYKKAYTG